MSTETNVTPAQELRAAASKIGEIAGAASHSGPWQADRWFVMTESGSIADTGLPADAEHIALWNPAVARLIGDWLESEAYGVEAALVMVEGLDAENLVRWPLAIARAINGGA